jgi:protein-arginine kinase activator protein McsA
VPEPAPPVEPGFAAVSLEDKEYELRKAISLEDYERAVVIKQEIESLKKKDVQ